jgi:hypothetical protein
MLKIDFTFQNIDKILRSSIKVDVPVKRVAETVQQDNIQNLIQKRSFDGSAIAPKQGKGELFRKSGELIDRSIIIKENSVLNYDVTVAEGRKQVGLWLQGGTKFMPARHWFGLNKARVKTEIDNILKNETKVSLIQ